MKKMRQYFILIFILFSSVTYAQEKDDALERIKNNFIDTVTPDLNDFKICEYYSRTKDKKGLVEKSIDPILIKNLKNIAYKEIYVTNQESNKAIHLGIITIAYSALPKEIHNLAHTGYFKNTKILTQYFFQKMDSKVVIYYSESFMDEKVKKYFDNLKATASIK